MALTSFCVESSIHEGMIIISGLLDLLVLTLSGQVHESQLDHVRKGCLTRTRNGVKADGSRIERLHVGWNGLQRGHTSGIITMNALGHDHVLRWNVAWMSSAPEPSTFIKSCFGSSHIGLVDSNARTWNHLLEGTASLDHHRLPCLEPYPMRETFGVVESQHALSTLPVAVKSEEIDTLAEGDHEQLGLHPHLLESETIKHDMLDNPAMHLKADMFVQPLTCTPSLPPPLTSSVPLFLDPLTSAEYKISEPPLPSTSSTSLPLHQLTGVECEVPFLSQSTMTIDADMESDDGDIQILDTPALPSPS